VLLRQWLPPGTPPTRFELTDGRGEACGVAVYNDQTGFTHSFGIYVRRFGLRVGEYVYMCADPDEERPWSPTEAATKSAVSRRRTKPTDRRYGPLAAATRARHLSTLRAAVGWWEALVGWQAADRLIHRLWGCAGTEDHSRSPLTQRLAVELRREVGGQPILGLPELVQTGIHHHTDTQPIASHHLLRTTPRNSSPESGRSEITAATLSVLDLRNTHPRA
jgi:hypothetical protein